MVHHPNIAICKVEYVGSIVHLSDRQSAPSTVSINTAIYGSE